MAERKDYILEFLIVPHDGHSIIVVEGFDDFECAESFLQWIQHKLEVESIPAECMH